MQIKAQQVPKKMLLSYLMGSDDEHGIDNENPSAEVMSSSRQVTTFNRASPVVVSKRKRAPSVRTTVFAMHSSVVTF